MERTIRMKKVERRTTVIIIAILVAIAIISLFWISGIASSEDSFQGTYNALDEKRTNVTELMGVTAASSTAISLLPGDAGTPIAEQLADLSGYFMFILAEIYLEKWMVTITGMLAFKILGVKGNNAAEFEKAGVQVKTIRLTNTGKIKESMSFPAMKYKEVIKENWEDSVFHNYLSETRFLFIVYQFNKNNELFLKGCQFWNMPFDDLENDVREVWERTCAVLREGLQVTRINGHNVTNFPKASENRVSHVRPHAQNVRDTDELPDGRQYPKHCFWLNNTYILSQLDERLVGD